MKSLEPQASIAKRQRLHSRLSQSPTVLSQHATATTDPIRCAVHPQPLSLVWSARYLLRNLRTAWPLIVSDQAMLLVAVVSGFQLAQVLGLPSVAMTSMGLCSLGAAVFLTNAFARLYPAVGVSADTEAGRSALALTILFASLTLGSLGFQRDFEPVGTLVCVGAVALVLVPLSRWITRRICGRFQWWRQPVVIFGDGETSQSVVQRLHTKPHWGLDPVGVVHGASEDWERDVLRLSVDFHEPPAAAIDLLRRQPIDRAIIAMPDQTAGQFHHTLDICTELFPHITIIPSSRTWSPLAGDGDGLLRHFAGFEHHSRLLSPGPHFVKRSVDVLMVLVLGLLLAPVMLAAAAILKLRSPGPILFAQERIGRGGVPFRLWKFRTMLPNAEAILGDYLTRHPELCSQWESEHKLENDPRIIPVIGHIFRQTSIDELPQLWNVLRGDMSVVGPRPLPVYHLEEFDPRFRRFRAKVTPGITGLWQVSSRSDGRPERFQQLDSEYIQNWSLWLDAKILLRTIRVTLTRSGAR